jgi:uncharacterized protein
MTEPVAVAILAKAPIAGFAKTRLIPALGAQGAAALQAKLIARAVETACAAAIGPVTLWAAPDERHPAFQALGKRGVALARQPDGDLGARMLAAFAAAGGSALVIGTDAPALSAEHLHMAAQALRYPSDVVFFPAEDGGYALIGAHGPLPILFSDMPWGTAEVARETRRRLTHARLRWHEPVTLWDIDEPADLMRLRETGLQELLPLGVLG